MKPEQFIREYGVDKARELLDQLHKLGCPDDMKITVINGMWQRTSNGFAYPELKRLVESVDRVNAFGGLKDAKAVVKMGKHYKYLKAHISNYESIYGGGDES